MSSEDHRLKIATQIMAAMISALLVLGIVGPWITDGPGEALKFLGVTAIMGWPFLLLYFPYRYRKKETAALKERLRTLEPMK